jgi:ABC-2 type transport system ATP-binding protein
MKQRLGVAAALLKDPELLILDEPSNGLDPVGQADMRDLIRRLGGGRTIILSSHDLSEVERLCDRVGIIGGGRMLAEGTVEELRGEAGLLVRAAPLDVAARLAERLAEVEEVEVKDGALRLATGPENAAQVARKLVSAGLDVSELRLAQRSLEEGFLELTRGRTAGADSIRDGESRRTGNESRRGGEGR